MSLLFRFFPRRTISTTRRLGGEAHSHGHHGDEPEYYNRLSTGFYKAMGAFWAFVVVFVAQDKYFTRPDEVIQLSTSILNV